MIFGRKKDDELILEGLSWRTEKRRIGDLVEWEENPRRLTEREANHLRDSLKKFGVVEPLVLNADGKSIIGGHMRRRVLIAEALLDPDAMIDVRLPSRALSEKEAQELALRLNRNTGEWDYDGLANLGLGNDELVGLGFDAGELGMAFKDTAPDTSESAPASSDGMGLLQKWKVAPGDLWYVGQHRIMCGDCTVIEDVERLFGGDNLRAAVLATDPPYGVKYDDLTKFRNEAGEVNPRHKGSRDDTPLENDEVDPDKLQALITTMLLAARDHMIENYALYLWHAGSQSLAVYSALRECGILVHRQIVWVKPSLRMGMGDYHWRHETCAYGWPKGKRPGWMSDRKEDTVWEIPPVEDPSHPTEKPVDLFLQPIRNHTTEGAVVYEPFAGAGSQILAAQALDRRCFAMELEPRYVAITLERLKAGGLEPRKEG